MNYTVVICTYNGVDFIEEQLQSIIRQSILPFEILVFDDCSSDGTVEKIESFVKRHDEISWSVTRNEQNLGYVANFSQAIGKANGDIIFLSDQDDVWEPHKAASMMDVFLKNSKVSVLCSNACLLYGNEVDKMTTLLGDKMVLQKEMEPLHFDLLLRKDIVTGATMAFRKTLVPDITPIPIAVNKEFIHDNWIGIVGSLNHGTYILNKCLIQYRIHPKQNVGISSGEKFNEGYPLLIHSIEKEYNRLSLSYQLIMRNPDCTSNENLKIIEKRLFLLKKIINSKHFFSKLLACSPFLLWYRVGQFDTLRKYFGNCKLYLKGR